MARITQAELEQLKQQISLLELAQSQGHQLKKQGKGYVLLCPFHQEKTPSCVITPSKNLYHCFGCNAAGSVLDWLIHTERLDYKAALQRLQALAGTLTTPPQAAPARLVEVGDDGQGLLLQLVEHYHQTLLDSPEILAWLAKRGLHHPEMLRHFKLGYAGRALFDVLPSPKTVGGREMRQLLAQLGVISAQTHQVLLSHCLIVPVIGATQATEVQQRGRVIQMYGRRTAPNNALKPGSSKHRYLAIPLRGVWNEQALIGSEEVILCEALLDALTFWCAGFRQVLASYGVNGFTDDHRQALHHHGIKRILIAYDADEAGNSAADKLAPTLTAQGFDVWRVTLPEGMDINEYALKSGQPERALGLALQNASRYPQPTFSDSVAPAIFHHERATLSHATPPTPATAPPSLLAARPDAQTMPGVNPHPDITATGELLLTFGSRTWRVRGGQKNHNSEVMKVTVQVRDDTIPAFHIDTLDMYHAKSRASYIKAAVLELDCEESVIKRDIGRVLLALEQQQDQRLAEALQPQQSTAPLSPGAEQAALALLKAPDLITRITEDLAACGVIGESANLLAGYLAAVSRKLDKPLAVLIQSSSAAGKSSLMDAILDLVPQEERVQYSAMTGQSLYYLGEKNLQHKILAIAEEEGVRQAAYALKLLQSDGELTIASTGKDDSSGDLVTREYTVKGPVMLMLTTTAIDVDEELLNRCLVLTINESREQTQAIHALQRQRQTLEGLLAENERKSVTQLHQNAQRLLKPLNVVNPFAHQLTFLSDKTRTRRDHMKYLTLIQSIALLHQYQREVKRIEHRGEWLEYIEVARSDIALANRLAHEILGRTLDEMPPQTRKLLLLIRQMVRALAEQQLCLPAEVRFTRRDIREHIGWSDSQLKNHCQRLVELEYLLIHGGSRGHLLRYELLWDGESGSVPHLCGLLDLELLDKVPGSSRKSGLPASKSAPSLGQVCLKSGWQNTLPAQAVSGLAVSQVWAEPSAVIREISRPLLRALPVRCDGAYAMQGWVQWLPMSTEWFRMQADTGLSWTASGAPAWPDDEQAQRWKQPQIS